MDGRPASAELNESVLALLPKGAENGDNHLQAVREAGNLRPLSLKNADAKLMASTLAHSLKKLVSRYATRAQRGFVAPERFDTEHLGI